jgi:hypothetical protein
MVMFGSIASSYASAGLRSNELSSAQLSGIKIEYLQAIPLSISANGINRFNFGSGRIVKIVGNSSQYGAVLSDTGSDLFLTSKLAPGEIIDLTLLRADGEVFDLRLYVSDIPPVIMKLDTEGQKTQEFAEKKEIKEMINTMFEERKSKYFVQEQKKKIQLSNKPNLVMEQYVTYRFGDLMGVGITYRNQSIKNRKINNNIIEPKLGKEELLKGFKDVLAIAIINENLEPEEKGKIFLVFKAGEAMDV